MDAVDASTSRLRQRLRSGDIGRNHQVLNELSRLGSATLLNRHDLPLVRREPRTVFRYRQRQRAASHTRHLQRLMRTIEIHQRGMGWRLSRSLIDPGLNSAVSQPCRRADKRPRKARALQLAFFVNLHLGDQCRTVLPGQQRAPAIRQGFGQHGHNLAGQINRIAAQRRRLIQRRTRMHIVRDIGNRDPEAIAARRQRLGIDRIVKVARVFAINSHKRKVA